MKPSNDTREEPSPTDAYAFDQFCRAIAGNNMPLFDALLPQMTNLDAENGRALLACVVDDRFIMAQKLLLRGVDTTAVSEHLQALDRLAAAAYMEKPSGRDIEELGILKKIRAQSARLDNWKSAFEKDFMPRLLIQKLEQIEAKIDALRDDFTAATSPQRVSLKKSGLPPPKP